MMALLCCLYLFRTRVSPLLQDFTIDGQAVDDIENADEHNAPEFFRDILLYVYGERICPGDAPCRNNYSLTVWGVVDWTYNHNG